MLAQEGTAFAAIVVADIWQWTPFVFIMMLAALANVDTAVLEAARVDGASGWQAIFLVKLPMAMHVIAITLVMRLIDAFRVLEVIYVLTFGGPGESTEILSLHIYKTAFVGQRLGSAAAISVLLLVVVAALSWLALRLSNPLKSEQRMSLARPPEGACPAAPRRGGPPMNRPGCPQRPLMQRSSAKGFQ